MHDKKGSYGHFAECTCYNLHPLYPDKKRTVMCFFILRIVTFPGVVGTGLTLPQLSSFLALGKFSKVPMP